jgi:hypothetical protein
MAAVEAAGPVTMMAAWSGPEIKPPGCAGVCTENLNPGVVVMESA